MNCYVTDGEKLYYFLLGKLSVNWGRFEGELTLTGRGSEFSEFFRELLTVNLVGRIIAAGSHYCEQYSITSPVFIESFRNYFCNYLNINYNDIETFVRLGTVAVKASNEVINQSTRTRITRWSKDKSPRCYMCNAALVYNNPNHVNAFTLEHIWPRSYGGNSFEENLLPACSSCNNHKKKHFASWAMPSIQSLIYSPREDEKRLQEVEGAYKFALHYRHVQSNARSKNISLKRSFQEIGPWCDIRILDSNDICDFFNLTNVMI